MVVYKFKFLQSSRNRHYQKKVKTKDKCQEKSSRYKSANAAIKVSTDKLDYTSIADLQMIDCIYSWG